MTIHKLHFLFFSLVCYILFSSVTTVYAEEKMPKCIEDWVAQGQYIKFNEHSVFVHASGPKGKEGVLVVHGYPGSSWDFAEVVGPVSKKTRIVVPDMIGFGHSDTPLKGTFKDNFSLLKQADLYEDVAAKEGLETVILVAHDMGQTVGLELMARQEENKLPFRIKHAILLNGSTIVDLIDTTPGQEKNIKAPDRALKEDPPREEWYKDLDPTYGAKLHSKEGAVKAAIECQVAQIYAKDGAKVMGNIVKYLLERKEFYDRWVGTFTGFHSAPMTVLWGLDDPVAKEVMADRVKAWRPETDLYKLEGIGHWPSIEAPEVIADAILHRLPSE
ncbi:MAG: alpha/beta fold hydrolase [Pseudomonadales bacterium]